MGDSYVVIAVERLPEAISEAATLALLFLTVKMLPPSEPVAKHQ